MASIKQPWGKFFWSDWMSDAQLRRCSPPARALWMDMLCIAAQHDPVGFVAVKGEALSISELARMTGFTETDASDLITELERNGVFSRDRKGRIYSRRMIRDAKKGQTARQNGKNGGNPSLSPNKGNSASDNRQDKGQDKPQKLEARIQREKEDRAQPLEAARGGDEIVGLRKEIVAALDGDMPPGDMHRVALWIAQGYTPALIRAVVVERIRGGKRPGSLAWFDRALADAAAVKAPEPMPPAAIAAPVGDDEWRKRLGFWSKSSPRIWSNAWGPQPQFMTTRVPDHLLVEFDVPRPIIPAEEVA